MLVPILQTIIRINNLHGRGDVVGIQLEPDWERGTVTIHCPQCEPITRRFSYDLASRVVTYAGHKRRID